MATPVDVSLCVKAYTSTSDGFASGCVPGADSTISGDPRCGAAATASANFDENSPNTRCCERSSISPNVSTSQNTVVPPLPSTTSQPSGSRSRSATPRRTDATTERTGDWRWLVPSHDSPAEARAATASGRTLDGPHPNRPSAGRRSAGMRMSSGAVLIVCHYRSHGSCLRPR
jgi:hypothetical protein